MSAPSTSLQTRLTLLVLGTVLLFGLLGPWLGKLMDRRGPKAVMMGGLALSAASVFSITAVNQAWQLWLMWGVGAGLVICLLFTLLPLLAVRRVSPLVALRAAFAEGGRTDPWRIGIYVLIAAAVVAFVLWNSTVFRKAVMWRWL